MAGSSGSGSRFQQNNSIITNNYQNYYQNVNLTTPRNPSITSNYITNEALVAHGSGSTLGIAQGEARHQQTPQPKPHPHQPIPQPTPQHQHPHQPTPQPAPQHPHQPIPQHPHQPIPQPQHLSTSLNPPPPPPPLPQNNPQTNQNDLRKKLKPKQTNHFNFDFDSDSTGQRTDRSGNQGSASRAQSAERSGAGPRPPALMSLHIPVDPRTPGTPGTPMTPSTPASTTTPSSNNQLPPPKKSGAETKEKKRESKAEALTVMSTLYGVSPGDGDPTQSPPFWQMLDATRHTSRVDILVLGRLLLNPDNGFVGFWEEFRATSFGDDEAGRRDGRKD